MQMGRIYPIFFEYLKHFLSVFVWADRADYGTLHTHFGQIDQCVKAVARRIMAVVQVGVVVNTGKTRAVAIFIVFPPVFVMPNFWKIRANFILL